MYSFKKSKILIWKEQCFFIWRFSFDLFSLLNVLFREIRNIRNWLSYATASFARHEFSRNKELFFAKYETRFVWNSREFFTKETWVSTLVAGTLKSCSQETVLLKTVYPQTVTSKWSLFNGFFCCISFPFQDAALLTVHIFDIFILLFNKWQSFCG